MSCFYRRCPACTGGTLPDGSACEGCEGWGGWWFVLGEGRGISVRRVPGDADHRPEPCEDDDVS